MTLLERIRARQSAIGTWMSLSDPTIAEINAELGFDFVLLDIEHTPNTLETVLRAARGVDAANTKTETVVRLSWNDHVLIKRVLDIGVSGVMAPMISDEEDAKQLVAATRYPPEGMRGVASERAARYGLDMPEYFERANEEIVTIAQIETRDGLDNVEDIANVDGIDALFVGPSDLSANLGVHGQWESQEFIDAANRVLAAGEKTGTAVSTVVPAEIDIDTCLDQGYDFVIAGADKHHIRRGGQQIKSAFKSAVADRES